MSDKHTLAADYLKTKILPTVGKIESVEQLRDLIKNTVWKPIVVQYTKLDELYMRTGDTYGEASITPDVFYCYVPLTVVQEWYLTHQELDRVHVYFEMKHPDVYRVTVAAKKYS